MQIRRRRRTPPDVGKALIIDSWLEAPKNRRHTCMLNQLCTIFSISKNHYRLNRAYLNLPMHATPRHEWEE